MSSSTRRAPATSRRGPRDSGSRGSPRPVLVVDGQLAVAELLSASVAADPALSCCGTATSVDHALVLARLVEPAVVVVGVDSLGPAGWRLVRTSGTELPRTAVVVLSGDTVGDWLPRAHGAGAAACAVRGGSLADLLTTIREARRGARPTGPHTPPVLAAPAAVGSCDLTTREGEVLHYLGMGLQAKSIASLMGISVHTCRGYIKVVYAKLHVTNRIEAVNAGVELHLLTA